MFWDVILSSLLMLTADGLLSGNATLINTTSFANETWSTNKFRTVAYFANWSVYKNFTPRDLPYQDLTHILYAFAAINNNTGEVYLSDIYADTEELFPGDHLNPGKNLYGCLKQLYILKKQNRNFKVLLSIGGATYSANFTSPISRPEGRLLFVQSAIEIVKNLGFDGLDIDWEFPVDEIQAENYAILLKDVRDALDSYGQSFHPQYHFELSAAGPAGAATFSNLNVSKLDSYLDFWNLMTYEYAGYWSPVSGDIANLYNSTSNPASTPFNTLDVLSNYFFAGIPTNKIVIGMPLFGRSFLNTAGPGSLYESRDNESLDTSIHDVRSLPLPGAIEYWDPESGSSFSYNYETKEMVSYDNVAVANQKAYFIGANGYGGAMWWESSGDRAGSNSLIRIVAASLGGYDRSMLAWSQNLLSYPDTVYANLRGGMPGE